MGVTFGLAVLMKTPEIRVQSSDRCAQGKGENGVMLSDVNRIGMRRERHKEREAMSKQKITDEDALAFHLEPTPGKFEISATVPMTTQRDLSLAYSPGVAVPCEAIAENPELAYDYTNKGNLVAVISNGTAVLGLGNLGALGSKPVMEGKAVLFKRFADVNSIDIELDTEDPDEVL